MNLILTEHVPRRFFRRITDVGYLLFTVVYSPLFLQLEEDDIDRIIRIYFHVVFGINDMIGAEIVKRTIDNFFKVRSFRTLTSHVINMLHISPHFD